jgi:membrane protein involved in colicin uptake
MDLVTMDREAYRAYEKREAQIAFYDEDVRSAAAEAAKELVAEARAKAAAAEAARRAAQEAAAKAQEAAQEAAAKAAQNKMLEIARNLKARGISLEDIIGSTNLSAEEVQKL